MLEERLLNKIKLHTIDRPICNSKLRLELNVEDSSIRRTVHFLRSKGEPIGSGTKGYWYCRTKREVDETTRHLKSRALSQLSLINKMYSKFTSQIKMEMEI